MRCVWSSGGATPSTSSTRLPTSTYCRWSATLSTTRPRAAPQCPQILDRKRKEPHDYLLSTHAHQHGPGCGHPAVRHSGHVDYLHDGHLHHPHEDHVDEHVIEVSGDNPERCTADHRCGRHDAGHV